MEEQLKPRGRGRGRARPRVPINDALKQLKIAEKSECALATRAGETPSISHQQEEEVVIVNKRGTSGTLTRISTNYFDLKSNEQWLLYKHHVEFTPPEDRTFMKKAFFNEHLPKFGGGRRIIFDGSTAFSREPLCSEEKPLELTCVRQSDGSLVKITISQVGTLKHGDSQTFQICNLIMRKSMRPLGLREIRRKFYDVEQRIQMPEYRVELLPGYLATISQKEHSLLMNTEVSYKVLRRDTALDLLHELYRQNINTFKVEFQKRIIGCVVMTTYNEKQYKITDVDFDLNPLSTFKKSDGSHMTFKNYFANRYGDRGTIRDDNQYLLVAKSTPKQILAGAPEIICLVPELCVQTGISEEMRSDHRFMGAMAQRTANNPQARIDSILEFGRRLFDSQQSRETFEEWGLSFTPTLAEFNARILPQQEILVGEKQSFLCNKNYEWSVDLRSRPMCEIVHCTNWVLVIFQRLRQDAVILQQELRFVARNMGMKISDAHIVVSPDDKDVSYVNLIDKGINDFNPQIVVALLNTQKTSIYNSIKRKCIVHKPVPSQVIVARNVRSRNFRAIATKIALQINTKLGGVPWRLNIPLKSSMIVGYDVCHDPGARNRSFGALVATTNTEFTKFFTRVRHHKNGDEISHYMGVDIRQAAEINAQKNNGQLPGRIFVYRDGIGRGQEKQVKEVEIQNIKDELKELYKSQSLQITFITVNKRISTRFFQRNDNPPPGTVVDDVVTLPGENDFFMISQSVRTGTVTPTHYKIILDEAKLGADKMQQLTYRLTHFYYNWSGTVRVPNVVQYAHKAAILNAQAVRQEHTTDISDTLYFL